MNNELFFFPNFLEVIERLDNIVVQVKAVRRIQKEDKLRELDCWSFSKRTEVERETFKTALVTYYDRRNPNQHNQLLCMVLNHPFQYTKVRASHIYKHAFPQNLEAFGIDRTEVNSPRNGLLLAQPIEQHFDVKHLCFLYDPMTQQLRLRILNPALFEHLLSAAFVEPTYPADAAFPATEFGLLDPPHYREYLLRKEQRLQAELNANPQHQGNIQDLQRVQQKLEELAALPQPLESALLRFPQGQLPWRRLLGYHARCSFQFARVNQWISAEEHEHFKQHEQFVRTSQGAQDPDLDLMEDDD